MTWTASPDAPGEVLARRARRRSDRCAEGYRKALQSRADREAAAAKHQADREAARERARTNPTPWNQTTENLAKVADSLAPVHAVANNMSRSFLQFSKAAATWSAEAATDLEERATEQAADAEARAALVPAFSSDLDDALADLDAATWPLTGLDLPPPGRLIRCQPVTAHAPPTACARGSSRRWDKGTPLETVGGN